MDIDETTGTRLPSVIHPSINKNEVEPVTEKTRLSHIHQRTSPYDDLDRWFIKDKVTISAAARRKYRQMRSDREKDTSHQ